MKCLLRRLKKKSRSSVCKIMICQILIPLFGEPLFLSCLKPETINKGVINIKCSVH